MSTPRTFPRCVAGIDNQHRDTCQGRFVHDKLAQLAKRPTVEYSALRAPSPDPRTNSRQIFDGYRSFRALRSLYEAFGDHMVGIRGKATFLTSQLAQTTARSKRSLALQLLAQAAMAIADVFDVRSVDGIAVTGCNDIRDAQINTDHTFNVNRLWCFNIARRQQVERAIDVGKVGFAAPRLQQFPLPLSAHKRDRLPSIRCPDRHATVMQIPRQNAIIVGNAAMFSKPALAPTIRLVRVGNFCNRSNNHLRCQPKRIFDVVIAQAVQIKLLERLRFPRRCTYAITRSIDRLHRLEQRSMLVRRWVQFNLGDELHIMNVPQTEHLCNRALKPGTRGVGEAQQGAPPIA